MNSFLNDTTNFCDCQDFKLDENTIKRLEDHKKLQADMFAVACEALNNIDISMEIIERIYECGSEILVHNNKIAGANFCKWRLCPMCAWRKSLKKYGENITITRYINEVSPKAYLLITLTVRNCKQGELSESINYLGESFKRFTNRKAFKNINQGYFKTLEVTYNKKTNSWHPHFHILLAVNQSYFTDKNLYLSQDKIKKLWQSAARLDYVPQCDVRAVKNTKDRTIEGAIAEISKYTTKIKSIIDESIPDETQIELIEELHKSLSSRRLITSSGIFKEFGRRLNIDTEDDDTVTTKGGDDTSCRLMSWDIKTKKYTYSNVQKYHENRTIFENISSIKGDISHENRTTGE